MKRLGLLVAALLGLLTPAASPAAGVAPAAATAATPELIRRIDIPYTQFRLPNGLTVLVHTDRKAPIVAVHVWYHIGSKDEPAGRTGFAHLFEHLMFYGSENNDGIYFKPLEEIGATDANGTTWYDRTNYFQNVPTPALELALYLESDRMGHLLGAVTQAKLDAQRGVVQNEKREGDNAPYGLVDYAIGEGLFPPGHPYRHSTIGSMADLDAATLDDVRGWFRANYAPSNTVLVLAGDIDVATARPLVEKYFGAIPDGAPPQRFAAPVPQRTSTTRETMHDAVANPRLYRTYVVPGRSDAATPLVDIAAVILAGGNSSRLYNDLVREQQLAVGVSGGVQAFEKVSLAQFVVDVKPGVDPARVEARMDALFTRFLYEGPTADEVARVASRAVAGTVRGLEAVGGFGGKATALAEGALYAGDPGFYKVELQRYADATPATVKAAANRWLARGDHRITVLDGERTARDIAKADNIVRAAPPASQAPLRTLPINQPRAVTRPAVTGTPALAFPAVERATLANGIPVTLARRSAIPTVRLSLSFDAGFAADSREKPGTSAMMLALLDEGTATRTGPQIAEEQERLGASIAAGASLDRTRVVLDSLTTTLPAALDLFADIVINPAFAAAEVERVRGQALAGIAREIADPTTLARRELLPLLFGAGHPYGVPSTGSGTAEGVRAVTPADLRAFHARWMRPDNAALFVVGDIGMAQLKPLLEARLGNWQATSAPRGDKRFPPTAQPAAQERIILFDRPGSPQSVIRAGHLLPRTGRDDPLAINAANDMLGGLSTSRLNVDIRETKGWAYGAGSGVTENWGQSVFLAAAPVQTDRTGDSIRAIRENIAALASGRTPITAEELARVIANATQSLPGEFESGSSVLGALERNALLARPDDWYVTLAPRTQRLTTDDVNAAARQFRPDALTWIVVGDRKQVEPQLRGLGIPLEVR